MELQNLQFWNLLHPTDILWEIILVHEIFLVESREVLPSLPRSIYLEVLDPYSTTFRPLTPVNLAQRKWMVIDTSNKAEGKNYQAMKTTTLGALNVLVMFWNFNFKFTPLKLCHCSNQIRYNWIKNSMYIFIKFI